MAPQSAPTRIERLIAGISGPQHTIATHGELRAAGLSSDQIRERRESGRLRVVYRGVYSAGPSALDAKGRWLAAVRACGPSAVISHRSAAALWGLRKPRSRQIEISIAGRNGRKSRKGITLHRPTRLTAAEVTVHECIPVTTVARTLLDLAAVLPRRALERAIDEAERQQLLDDHALQHTLEANRGRRGAASLAALLEGHRAGSTQTRTDIEELFLELCDKNAIERPTVNVPVGPYTADFLWPERALIVETDGRESHGTRAAFEHDRARDAWLTAKGYRVVRFTYRQVTTQPAKTASLVARLLRSPPRRRLA